MIAGADANADVDRDIDGRYMQMLVPTRMQMLMLMQIRPWMLILRDHALPLAKR